MKKRAATIAQILVGLVFLVSAFAKAWGGNAFANLVIQYGADWLTVFVPIVIAIETGLAAMMLLGIYTKKASLGAAIFVFGISLGYLYGVLVKGITDCGCFGVLHALNMRPLGTFIRNIILIGLCMVGYCYDTNQRLSTWWKVLVMLVLLVSSITKRTTPMPQPPVGGMPYSTASRKSSSISEASSSPSFLASSCFSNLSF